jgi:inhibitor of KinA sporulation pathway (predicted exonuclease)
LEGIYVVVAIIIALFNFAAKQQKNQGGGKRGMNRQQGQYRQKPVQRQKHIPQWSEGPFADLGKSWNELFGSPEEHVPESVPAKEHEGIEIEDRSRTGSLVYTNVSQSSEGTCDEHPEHSRQDAFKAEITETEEEGFIFEITEDNLLRSVVMAEVLGPPRAMKRRIR